MLFPAIRRSISPTPIGRKPGLLSNGMRQHAKKVSRECDKFGVVQIFLTANS